MGLRCYYLALLLGVASVTIAQYQNGPPAAFYGPPIIQQAQDRAPLPPGLGATFAEPVRIIRIYPETETVAASQSISEERLFEATAAQQEISFDAPALPSAPEAPQLNAPAEIYGLPGVVTETISAPPSQPEIPQFITPVQPQAPVETPIPSSTTDLEASAEININNQNQYQDQKSTIVAEVAVAPPSPSEIRPFDSPATQPQQAPHEISSPPSPVPIYGVPAEVVQTEHLEIVDLIPSSPKQRPVEAPAAPTPASIDTPVPPPPTPEVNIPAIVYGPPSSENEIVPIPQSPPALPHPSSQATVEVHSSAAIEQEILVSPPSAPLLPPSSPASSLSPQSPPISEFPVETPETVPSISEFPVETPQIVPHVYGPPIISRKIVVAPPPLLKLRSYIFPIKIRVVAPWIPIPRTYGLPAEVYGPPQLNF